jgi:hypothetical protein
MISFSDRQLTHLMKLTASMTPACRLVFMQALAHALGPRREVSDELLKFVAHRVLTRVPATTTCEDDSCCS